MYVPDLHSDQEPTQPACVIHSDDLGDRIGCLRSMGLTVAQLEKAVQGSLGGFTSTTAYHPKSAPGTYAYHEGTAALRRAVMPDGVWDYDEDDNQPRTFSQQFGIAIVVQTGDENTGLINQYEPKARNPKGLATEKKIASNHDHPVLFTMAPKPITDEDGEMSYVNWVLLIAVVGTVMRSELSLPRKMVGGKPCGWVERIILPEIEVGGADAVVSDTDNDGDTGPEADIDIAWKK